MKLETLLQDQPCKCRKKIQEIFLIVKLNTMECIIVAWSVLYEHYPAMIKVIIMVTRYATLCMDTVQCLIKSCPGGMLGQTMPADLKMGHQLICFTSYDYGIMV